MINTNFNKIGFGMAFKVTSHVSGEPIKTSIHSGTVLPFTIEQNGIIGEARVVHRPDLRIQNMNRGGVIEQGGLEIIAADRTPYGQKGFQTCITSNPTTIDSINCNGQKYRQDTIEYFPD